MPDLGTLDFSVRLKDETARQAEEIKKNLLSKLQLDFDRTSYSQMLSSLRAELSKESFKVKIEADVETARQAVKDSIAQTGRSFSNMEIDLSGLQGSAAMSRDIIELQRDIHGLTQDVEEYRQAWRKAARTHGEYSSEAKAAFKIYESERQRLADMKNMLFGMTKDRQAYNLATREQAKAEREAAKGAKEMEQSQLRLNGQLVNGVRISTSLQNAFTSLYSVHLLKEFLSKVIEIGGQLEKQRISMGAILGDTAKANALFEQIKELAIKSPFGVVELDQYTKQLAAYGFEYNELYDMIKRLADISAGAGQDISRLTLALGHVRSQTYLTGYTMRQFSMNNIPMLKMLAEYYSELEKRIVSTAEVQERISKKQVSYEDVIAQIRRLTDEGGMFYDMQEKIADSLQAKWKNLRDAFSIMYGELAESGVGDILKSTAQGLTELTKSWRMIMNLLSTAATIFGVTKLNAWLLNLALKEQERIETGVATATATATAAQNAQATAMQRVTTWANKMGLALNVIGRAIKGLVSSPFLWVSVAIEALTAVFTHFSEKTREAEDRMESVYNTAQEGYKNLSKYADKLSNVNIGKMSDDDFTAGISELVQAVKDYAPNSAQILKDVEAVESLKDKYKLLRDEVLLLSEAYEQMSGIGNMLNAANDSTDGIFDESFLKNVKDYQEAIEKTDKHMNSLLQHHALLNQAISFAASTNGNFAQAINGKSVKEQIELLNEFPKAWDAVQNYLLGKSYKAYGQFNTYFSEFRTKFHDAKETMQDDLDSFAQRFDNIAKSTWGEGWKDDAMRVQSVMQSMKVWFEQSNIPIERTKELMDLIFKEKWHLDIDFGAATDSSSPFGDGEDGKKEDEFLKSIQKRVKAIQDARKEYEALLKLGLSSEDALGKIAFFDVADSDVIDYKKAIQNLSKQLGSGTSERKDYQKELAKYLLGIDKEVMQEQIDQSKEALKTAVKEIDNYIKEQSSKFNLYKSLLESTGDEDFARNAFKDGQVWDEYAEGLRDKLKEISGIAVNNWHMEDSLAEEIFGKDTPALKLYQEIVEQIGKNYTDALESAAGAMSKLQTTEEKIANLQRQITEWENDTSGIIDHTAEIENAKNEIEELKQSLFSTLPVYEQIFGDTAYRSIASIKEGIRQMNEIIANATESKDSKTGKAKGVASSYIDSKGVKQEVDLTLSEFRRLKEQADKLFEAWKDKNAFSAAFEAFKNLKKVLQDPESSPGDKAKGWAEFTSSIASCADVVGGLADSFADMFDKLGNEGMASAMEDIQAGMSTISNIGKGFAEGGIFGGAIAAVGEVANWIGRIADKHDKKLDKAIEKSVREVKKLENEYKNLETQMRRALGGIYTTGGYQKMLEDLKKQRNELAKQYDLESRKKKKDADKLEDYKQEIEDIDDQIRHFAEDMANTLYGIDIKSWAKELTDAVVDAWAKGEDAAQAWHDKVRDLVKDLTANVLTQKVVEVALQPVLNRLTEEMTKTNGKLALDSIDNIAHELEEAGQVAVGTITNILESLKNRGWDFSSSASSASGTISKSTQSITEETGSLFASYLNAVRADVSVIRNILERSSGGDVVTDAQLKQLNAIAANTARTAENTAAIADIYAILQKNVNGINRFYVK